MKIGSRTIGEDSPPLVIAEIGINHGGSIDVAKRMVELVAEAGGEVAKFQIHHVEDEMSKEARSIVPQNASKSIYEIMEECALTPDEDHELKEFCEEHGLLYMATAFSRAAARQLKDMDVAAIKIGSGECNHYPLIRFVADFGIPLIVSTGMNSLESVQQTYVIIKESGTDFCLLHCVNRYPTDPEWVSLGAISEMQAAFDVPIGFSDHSVGSAIALASVALGATVLERHFTDSMDREGPDIACSMDPGELKWLIANSRDVWKASGGSKRAHGEEKVTSDFAFASLVADSDIEAGEVLTESNLWARRPGNGIVVTRYMDVINNYRSRDRIPAGTQISWEMLEEVS